MLHILTIKLIMYGGLYNGSSIYLCNCLKKTVSNNITNGMLFLPIARNKRDFETEVADSTLQTTLHQQGRTALSGYLKQRIKQDQILNHELVSWHDWKLQFLVDKKNNILVSAVNVVYSSGTNWLPRCPCEFVGCPFIYSEERSLEPMLANEITSMVLQYVQLCFLYRKKSFQSAHCTNSKLKLCCSSTQQY